MSAGLLDMTKDFVARLELSDRNRFAVRADQANRLSILQDQANRLTFGLGLDEHHRPFLDLVPAQIRRLTLAPEIHHHDLVAGLQVGKVVGLAARRESLGVHSPGVYSERPGRHIGIVDTLGMHEKETRRRVADQHPFA
jgi:hypothetical protein